MMSGRIIEHADAANVLVHGSDQDIFHSNSIQVVPRGHPGLWRKGDLLVCIRELDIIVVIDSESGALLWAWGAEELEAPHHATQLPDGNILLFDNGVRRKSSRVLQVDPAQRRILWSYDGSPPESFYSDSRGGRQQLPNGNILITETNKGRVFEVSSDKRLVWEYYDTNFRIGQGGRRERGAIYRMTRIEEKTGRDLLGAGERRQAAGEIESMRASFTGGTVHEAFT